MPHDSDIIYRYRHIMTLVGRGRSARALGYHTYLPGAGRLPIRQSALAALLASLRGDIRYGEAKITNGERTI